MLTKLNWMQTLMMSPENEGGTGAAPAATDPAAVLYPNENKEPGGAGEGSGDGVSPAPEAAAGSDQKEGDVKEGEAKDDGQPDPMDVVPEDGKYTLSAPEGFDLDPAAVEQYSPKFKEAGLTGKQAQAALNMHAEFLATMQQQQAEQHAKEVSGWLKQAETDKEIGGVNWDATKAHASSFVRQHGTAEFKALLDQTGLGNHPEMIRIMAKAGALISEDTPAQNGGGGSGQTKDRASILYPDDQPKR